MPSPIATFAPFAALFTVKSQVADPRREIEVRNFGGVGWRSGE
ncbi:MAG: hypothetical protein ACTH1D_08275 [Mycobacteriaceae bacterium]